MPQLKIALERKVAEPIDRSWATAAVQLQRVQKGQRRTIADGADGADGKAK